MDTATAFRGVIESMSEQIDKVTLAATGQEESRYAQYTLDDMRANLEGGRTTYNAFSDWLKASNDGPALDASIQAGFDRVLALYNGCTSTESLPPAPAGFDPAAPTPAQLDTPYGHIFAGLTMETDPSDPTSLVSSMNAAADVLRIPILPPR
jgi:iron uptake system component EfeO